MSFTIRRYKGRAKGGAPAKRGRANEHNIVLTYVPEEWRGREGDKSYVHQCEGWIARWSDGDRGIACWSKTRKGAYSKAYRFMKGGS